jgi:hypothetical protein
MTGRIADHESVDQSGQFRQVIVFSFILHHPGLRAMA